MSTFGITIRIIFYVGSIILRRIMELISECGIETVGSGPPLRLPSRLMAKEREIWPQRPKYFAVAIHPSEQGGGDMLYVSGGGISLGEI